jgi:hypothetical protein
MYFVAQTRMNLNISPQDISILYIRIDNSRRAGALLYSWNEGSRVLENRVSEGNI